MRALVPRVMVALQGAQGIYSRSDDRREVTAMDIQEVLNRIAVAQQHLTDDVMFRECVSDVLMALQVEDIDFASELAVSRSTVNRWKNGRSVPHPAMRRPVYAALRRRAQARLRDTRRNDEPASSSGQDKNPYNRTCPHCGQPSVSRERRPNGNDRCKNGHEYPSSSK